MKLFQNKIKKRTFYKVEYHFINVRSMRVSLVPDYSNYSMKFCPEEF